MTIKYAVHPVTGVKHYFGRKHSPAPPRLRFRDFALKSLPSPPASVDYSQKALTSLRNIYKNDTEGCCVIAAGYHFRGVTSGNADAIKTFTDAQVDQDYSAIGGYVPGDPNTDNGCDPVVAMQYWQKTGFPDGVKIAGFLSVDATNPTEIMQAIWLFESVQPAIDLPDAYVNPMPSTDGFIWDVAGPPVPANGHEFEAQGYGANGLIIDTWAMFGFFTYGAAAKYCVPSANGDLYCMISPDMIAKGQAKAPNGFAWADLIADANSIVPGSVPIPVPVPPPPPPVTPPPPPVVPPQTIQQQVDAIFATLIAHYAAYPELVWVLKTAQYYVDFYLQHSGFARERRSSILPAAVYAAVDSGFSAAQDKHPKYKNLLLLVQGLVDRTMPTT
jgi:hypothetical protein